jgi:hypothetical protein
VGQAGQYHSCSSFPALSSQLDASEEFLEFEVNSVCSDNLQPAGGNANTIFLASSLPHCCLDVNIMVTPSSPCAPDPPPFPAADESEPGDNNSGSVSSRGGPYRTPSSEDCLPPVNFNPNVRRLSSPKLERQANFQIFDGDEGVSSIAATLGDDVCRYN